MSPKRVTLSTNQKLTLVISFASVIVALGSVLYANKANQIAVDAIEKADIANQIAIESNKLVAQSLTQALPAIMISNWGQALYDLHQDNDICFDQFGNLSWSKELVIYFDITNSGGRAIALLDTPLSETISTSLENINVKVTFSSFEAIDEFDNWVEEMGLSIVNGYIKQNAELIIPLNIDSGDTRRIVLKEHVTMDADTSLSPRQLLTSIRQDEWIAHPTFLFAQNTSIQADVPIWKPSVGIRNKELETLMFYDCQN